MNGEKFKQAYEQPQLYNKCRGTWERYSNYKFKAKQKRQKSKSTQKLEYQKICCEAVSHRKVYINMISQW